MRLDVGPLARLLNSRAYTDLTPTISAGPMMKLQRECRHLRVSIACVNVWKSGIRYCVNSTASPVTGEVCAACASTTRYIYAYNALYARLHWAASFDHGQGQKWMF